jgi:hypothetical protein
MDNERTPRVLLPGYMPGDTISVGPFSFRQSRVRFREDLSSGQFGE